MVCCSFLVPPKLLMGAVVLLHSFMLSTFQALSHFPPRILWGQAGLVQSFNFLQFTAFSITCRLLVPYKGSPSSVPFLLSTKSLGCQNLSQLPKYSRKGFHHTPYYLQPAVILGYAHPSLLLRFYLSCISFE